MTTAVMVVCLLALVLLDGLRARTMRVMSERIDTQRCLIEILSSRLDAAHSLIDCVHDRLDSMEDPSDLEPREGE